MKKYLVKIVLIALGASLTLTLHSASAEDNEEDTPTPSEATQAGLDVFSNPFEKPSDCADPQGADKGYIITILEEAFETETDNSNPNYKTRICYRNNYTAKDTTTGEVVSYSQLYKKCGDEKVKEWAANPPRGAEIRFGCKEVLVILSKGGTSMIYGYIGMIYRWAGRLVGLIAVLVIVLSGMQLAAAGGDQDAVNSAKTRIIQSLTGIAILFLSSLILNTINPGFYIISP